MKKVAQYFQTQPLKTMKTMVWRTRNHWFRLSSFAAKCLEKCFQGALIWDTLATEIRKRHPRTIQNKTEKSTAKKHRLFVKMESSFLVFGVTFSTFFGPGCHLAPKPPKTRKRYPKGFQNDPPKPQKNADNQKKRYAGCY